MSEESEDSGTVIRVNADFDEKNRNAKGNPLADYQPDEKEGHRITADDPNLVDGSLSIDGDGRGKWRLTFPENVKVWRKTEGDEHEEIVSSRLSKKMEVPISCEFKVEGIKGSQLVNDVKILAEFAPARSKKIYRDSVLLTVLETQFAVTFDDGPLPEKTDKIVRALKKFYYSGEPLKAAFFQVGSKIKKFGDLTQFAHQQGHLVLNHTHHHTEFGYRMLNDEEIREDILLCAEEIRRTLGREPEKILRSRALREDRRFERKARRMGYRFCTGELLDDWEASSVEEIQTRAEEILESWNTREDPRLHPYPSILIFHEFPELVCDHIGEIIGYLQDRGFVLVNFDPSLIY
ncbi:MAG: polysaccharide deacetylase family protein [Candidatus Zixiibacteriota bacterium]|nr:MAG: polysaccharide deacetylase family protein [candidate division Zixibacteria bacterium]